MIPVHFDDHTAFASPLADFQVTDENDAAGSDIAEVVAVQAGPGLLVNGQRSTVNGQRSTVNGQTVYANGGVVHLSQPRKEMSVSIVLTAAPGEREPQPNMSAARSAMA